MHRPEGRHIEGTPDTASEPAKMNAHVLPAVDAAPVSRERCGWMAPAGGRGSLASVPCDTERVNWAALMA